MYGKGQAYSKQRVASLSLCVAVDAKISGYRSVEKRGGEVLGFEAREWKTMRKRFIVFHSRASEPSTSLDDGGRCKGM